MTELFLDLAGRSEPTKSRRLQAALREAIRAGRLRSGDRLPASRALAEELGWARNVVVEAYDQLNAEGYLVARVGDGTRVAPRPLEPVGGSGPGPGWGSGSAGGPGPGPADLGPAEPDPAEPGSAARTAPEPSARINLQPGLPDLVAFPSREWRRSLNNALSRMPSSELGYHGGTGAEVLRRAIVGHLARTRAVNADPDNVVITTGVSASLRLLAAELVSAGAVRGAVRVAVEDPGAYTQWDALRAAGADVVPVPVDGEGIDTSRLGGPDGSDGSGGLDADMVVVTPAHQYPLGGVLTPERRHRLVAWARARPGRLIIEDDYDAEFRYDRQPVGAIAGIAPDVTAHTGSVAKTLAPALRLGWLCLPAAVAERVKVRLAHEFVTPDVVQQHALADLLVSGGYDRIVRARRRAYHKRRALMVDALDPVSGVTAVGAAGGLHLTIMLPDGVDDRAVSAALLDSGIDVPPLSRYRLRPGPPGLVASYASLNQADAADFARYLAQSLSAVSQRR